MVAGHNQLQGQGEVDIPPEEVGTSLEQGEGDIPLEQGEEGSPLDWAVDMVPAAVEVVYKVLRQVVKQTEDNCHNMQ